MTDFVPVGNKLALPSMLDSEVQETFAEPEECYRTEILTKPNPSPKMKNEPPKSLRLVTNKTDKMELFNANNVSHPNGFKNYHWKKSHSFVMNGTNKKYVIPNHNVNRHIRNQSENRPKNLQNVNKALSQPVNRAPLSERKITSTQIEKNEKNLMGKVPTKTQEKIPFCSRIKLGNEVNKRKPTPTLNIPEISSGKFQAHDSNKYFNQSQNKTKSMTTTTQKSNWKPKDITIRKKQSFGKVNRSETVGRYSIPPLAKPVRSVSNLSELIKSGGNTLEDKTHHIYATIDSQHSHKKAVERMDEVLNGAKSVHNLLSTEYDVPKHTNGSDSHCRCCPYTVNGVHDHLTNMKTLSKSNNELRSSDDNMESGFNSANYDDEFSIHPSRLRTLDIKEEKRKTPDIVKCSRRKQAMCDTADKNRMKQKGKTVDSRFLRGTTSTKALNSISNTRMTENKEEEIYSVIDDSPQSNNLLNTPDGTSEHFGQLTSSNLDYGISSGSNSNSSSTDYNSSSCSLSGPINRPKLEPPCPQKVTFCSSKDELVSLVSSDPNALVYVYKYNGNKNSAVIGQPDVYILSRTDDRNLDATEKLKRQNQSLTTEVPEENSSPDNKKSSKSSISKINRISTIKGIKSNLFQRLKRTPVTKDENLRKSGKSVKSKNSEKQDSESQGVVFIEPNYNNEDCLRTNETEIRLSTESNNLFDYSNNWQYLGHVNNQKMVVD